MKTKTEIKNVNHEKNENYDKNEKNLKNEFNEKLIMCCKTQKCTAK